MKRIREELTKVYPFVGEYDNELIEDMICQEILIQQVEYRTGIPAEELINFFYKAKLRRELIERKEKEYVRQNDDNL